MFAQTLTALQAIVQWVGFADRNPLLTGPPLQPV